MATSALNRARDATVPSPNYPDYLMPCLATDIGRPPTGKKWAHEIKFDGFRSQLHLRNGEVTIYSRGGHDWTERYRSVADQAARLSAKHLVIDGEIVVLREDGTCDFWALQKGARASVSDRVTYFAFDLLYQGGEDLRRLPFIERKELLRKALDTPFDRIRYVEHFAADGPTVWAHAHKINVEGIVSKRVDSPYRSARGGNWIKTPCRYREILLVAGMAFDENFSGLYLARRQNGALIYAGKVEDGFTDETISRLRGLLDPLVTRRPSVSTPPKPNAKWIEPIVEVRILHRGGLTAERVRRPVFEGVVEKRKAEWWKAEWWRSVYAAGAQAAPATKRETLVAPRVLIEMAYLKFRSPIASTPRRPRPSLLDQQEDRQSAAAAPDRPGALAKLARAPHGHAMIENIRTHPYTRAVCVETARLFEQRAARDLFKAQYWADRGGQDQAQELQANARLAQQRATAWHLRAKNAADLASAAAVASCRRFTPSRNREKEIDER